MADISPLEVASKSSLSLFVHHQNKFYHPKLLEGFRFEPRIIQLLTIHGLLIHTVNAPTASSLLG